MLTFSCYKLERRIQGLWLTYVLSPTLLRILSTGGEIRQSRINGKLNVSRAFGDFGLKTNHHPLDVSIFKAKQVSRSIRNKINIEYSIMNYLFLWSRQKTRMKLIFSVGATSHCKTRCNRADKIPHSWSIHICWMWWRVRCSKLDASRRDCPRFV